MDPLRREVMAPRRQVRWLGPVFVLGGTLALTMSMAAMALAPHPRHHHHGRPIHRADMQRAQVPIAATDAAATKACAAPVYHASPDGMVDVTYEVCAPRLVTNRAGY